MIIHPEVVMVCQFESFMLFIVLLLLLFTVYSLCMLFPYEGEFGDVCQGWWHKTNEMKPVKVAVKTLKVRGSKNVVFLLDEVLGHFIFLNIYLNLIAYLSCVGVSHVFIDWTYPVSPPPERVS